MKKATLKGERKNFILDTNIIKMMVWLKQACRVTTLTAVVRHAIATLTELMIEMRTRKAVLKFHYPDGSSKVSIPSFQIKTEVEFPMEAWKAFQKGIPGRGE